jgi:phosphohistidine phosphatase SixA
MCHGQARAQATRIGERFREQGILAAAIFTSACCRCRETAARVRLGEVRVLPTLNSFFAQRGEAEARTCELRQWLVSYAGDGPLVLVTHQVNITEFTGVFPRPGEITVIRRNPEGGFDVMGRL